VHPARTAVQLDCMARTLGWEGGGLAGPRQAPTRGRAPLPLLPVAVSHWGCLRLPAAQSGRSRVPTIRTRRWEGGRVRQPKEGLGGAHGAVMSAPAPAAHQRSVASLKPTNWGPSQLYWRGTTPYNELGAMQGRGWHSARPPHSAPPLLGGVLAHTQRCTNKNPPPVYKKPLHLAGTGAQTLLQNRLGRQGGGRPGQALAPGGRRSAARASV
jgi:hypothetical protein